MTSSHTDSTATDIIIVGGGFGGVRAALLLAKLHHVHVTLISRDDSFAYYPQLYHAATGGSRSESAIPLHELFAGLRVKLIRDNVTGFDPGAKTITTEQGQNYHYDELILALGSVTNYFGIKGLQQYSFDIKTIQGAEAFKQHLHTELIEHKKPEVNYVVVGGGPTGVELAGALGDYLRRIVQLHGVKSLTYNIDLVEAAPRLLPRLPESFARRVQRRLERLGVTVMTGAVVESENETGLKLKGKQIVSKTVVWTAGVANSPFFHDNAKSFTLDQRGHVVVNDHMEARPHVYVIGDNAATKYAGMAQTAVNDGNFVASDIERKLRGVGRRPYVQSAPISVIPVGDNWAAAQWGPVLIYGYIGWILRRLADLIAYRDVESLPKALRLWRQDSRHEDNCPICEAQTSEA